jgi:hypothetical protein
MFLRKSGPTERNNMNKEQRKAKKKKERELRVKKALFNRRKARMIEKGSEKETARKQMKIEKLMRQFDEEDQGESSV